MVITWDGRVLRSWDVDILDDDGSAVDASFLCEDREIGRHIDDLFDIPGTEGVTYKNFTAILIDGEIQYIHFNDPYFTVKIRNSDLVTGKNGARASDQYVPIQEERRNRYFKQNGSN